MDREYLVRQHGESLITRFNALYKVGYRTAPHWSLDMQFALVHPNKKAPRLALNDDASVALLFPRSQMPEHEIIDIPADDRRGFDRLISRIPATNFLQMLGQTSVGRAIETVVALAFVGLLWFLATKGLEALFPGLKDLW